MLERWGSWKLSSATGSLAADFDGQNIWVFPKIVGKPPKWMVKIMENPIKMDDLGKTLLKIGHPYRKVVFQPSIFRGELLVFRAGIGNILGTEILKFIPQILGKLLEIHSSDSG